MITGCDYPRLLVVYENIVNGINFFTIGKGNWIRDFQKLLKTIVNIESCVLHRFMQIQFSFVIFVMEKFLLSINVIW